MSSTSWRVTLIYNPIAGFDDWQRHIEAVAHFWGEQGWQVDLQTTGRPGHATELAASAAAAGHQLVLVAGGDGTLHEAANGLIGTPCALAPLPAGTTNCLARDLGLPQPTDGDADWLLAASAHLLNGRIQGMDVGQCHNGKHFLLWAGVGVDSRIVEAVEPRSRLLKRFGLPGYILKATPAFLMFRGERTRITADATTVEGDFFMVTVCNSRLFSGGMFNLNRDGVLDDGELEVWAFPGRYPPRMIWHSLFMAANYHAHRPDVILLRGKHIILQTATPQPFHLDGELNRTTPMVCTVLPAALCVLAPDTAPADLFQYPGTRLTAG